MPKETVEALKQGTVVAEHLLGGGLELGARAAGADVAHAAQDGEEFESVFFTEAVLDLREELGHCEVRLGLGRRGGDGVEVAGSRVGGSHFAMIHGRHGGDNVRGG